MKRIVWILLGALPLVSGCSAFQTAINRPVVENSIEGVVSTVSLSADRRSVVVVTSGKNTGKYCAEPPPDTAKEIATEFRAAIEAQERTGVGKGAASVADLYREQLRVLAARTPALEALRITLYSVCQMYVIEALTPAQTYETIGKLIDSYPWNIAPPPPTSEKSSDSTPAAASTPDKPQAPTQPDKPQAPTKPDKPEAPAKPR
jgi:hypothetical protein